jgi:hypothetical protein
MVEMRGVPCGRLPRKTRTLREYQRRIVTTEEKLSTGYFHSSTLSYNTLNRFDFEINSWYAFWNTPLTERFTCSGN